jgi:hypothetical protein
MIGTCPVPGFAECLRGGKQLISVTTSTPGTNGCGSGDGYFNQLFAVGLGLYVPEFKTCCDGHDVCWGTCNMGNDGQFDSCNADLYSCSVAKCKQYYEQLKVVGLYDECLGRAAVVYDGVQQTSVAEALTGCGNYQAIQADACVCVDCDGHSVPGMSIPGSTSTPTDNLLDPTESAPLLLVLRTISRGSPSQSTSSRPWPTMAIERLCSITSDNLDHRMGKSVHLCNKSERLVVRALDASM